MGLAIDTFAAYVRNVGATVTAATPASGDQFTVRSFNPPAYARLERIIRGGATSGLVQVRSPLLHDDVRGIRFITAENPAVMLMPPEMGQNLTSQDTLIVELTGGTAEYDVAVLCNYYSNLAGGAARLHSWGDISALIANIKTLQVAATGPATPTAWADTVITQTENLLKANTDYAVLGYVVDVPVTCVAIRGQDTGNLRVGGPGTTKTDDTSDYFVAWSNREGTPHIPVINAANAGGTFVSVMDVNASTAVNVQLVLAQLSQNLAS